MRRFAGVGAAACAVGAAALLPTVTQSNYLIGIAVSACLFTVAAASLNLVYGYTGLLSFAQLAFWGIGGYCAALTVATFGGNFWQGLLLAAGLNGALALAVGYPALRLNRHAFVIVSLSFALLANLIARDWTELTRGPLGIPGLPAPTLFGFAFRGTATFYYLALTYAMLALGLLYAIASSQIGVTLRAIKQNEILAQSQGISGLGYKLLAFTVGAVLTAVAGGIFVFHLTIVDPLILDFYYMQTFLIMVIIGGAGSFWGVVVAGVLMSALPELLRFSADLRMVLYGAILVAAVLVMPDGVAGWLRRRRVERLRAALQ
ncbi:MAG: branched-chain amino acid ABC transporter permease [Proteobacteria bacterium]|nr:branched-chain amino acid ABC transporter permease [Pseudomonadota bacterium]